jgi:hypothetical protein
MNFLVSVIASLSQEVLNLFEIIFVAGDDYGELDSVVGYIFYSHEDNIQKC